MLIRPTHSLAAVPAVDETIDAPVLHVYSGNLYGGIEVLLTTLARSADSGADPRPEFALCFPGRLRDELLGLGVTVHDLGAVQFRNPATVIRARHRLARLLRRQQFAAVVTHACWPHALLAPVVRRAGRPVVFWQHDFLGSGHWIERLAVRTRPDLVISNSRASAATLDALFPGVPAEVIYCPVIPLPVAENATEARAATRRELGVPDNTAVIIMACRMERWKGHALLLDALGRLRDLPGWVAWVAGGAQRPSERVYAAEVEAQARRLGISDRISLMGQRDDVARLLAAADIHCQPNLSPEPFGIAFVEALHARLPVVSTRLGGAAEIVAADCGILVDPNDSLALADVLGRLIADPAERARLGAAGPDRAAALCDPVRSVSRLSDLIRGFDVAKRC